MFVMVIVGYSGLSGGGRRRAERRRRRKWSELDKWRRAAGRSDEVEMRALAGGGGGGCFSDMQAAKLGIVREKSCSCLPSPSR
jgi:hypothetical protein